MNGMVANGPRETDLGDPSGDYDTLFRIIRERRSIRHYKSETPNKDVILKLVDSARYAPSATNLQPWLFLIITNGEVKQQMAEAVLLKLKKASSGEDVIGGKNLKEFRHEYFLFFRKAPVVIAPVFKPYPQNINLGYEETGEGFQRHRLLGVESTSTAVQNLLLTAHALGLGACWLDGPLIAKKELESILAVKPPWELLCLVAVGYPDEQLRPPRRKKLKLIARFIS